MRRGPCSKILIDWKPFFITRDEVRSAQIKRLKLIDVEVARYRRPIDLP